MTGPYGTILIVIVSDALEKRGTLPINVVMCIDSEALDRFAPVLRHLLVGMIDQAIRVRLVSSDPRIEKLKLGPVQTLVHKSITWPLTGRRLAQLFDALSGDPPALVHALSHGCYRYSGALAKEFDADWIMQVTSLPDCDALADLPSIGNARFLTFGQPLAKVLTDQLGIEAQYFAALRPGVRATESIACFAEADRTPTILCRSAFDRGSGVDRLIEAVELLRTRGHNLMLFLLGEGRQESTLRRMIRDRKLSSCVTLSQLAGDVSGAIRGADIFVRPSSDGAFHSDVLEAMAAGLAVVTHPCSICDHIRPGETALVCEKPSAQALADVLEKLLTDRAAAIILATRAVEYVRTHHTVSAMAEGTANAYRALVLARSTFPIKE